MRNTKAKKLLFQTKMEIIPTAPFHFDSTFYKPAHFPSSDTKWEKGKRWDTMLWQGQKLGLIFENVGTVNKPKVIVKIYSEKELSLAYLQELKNELIWQYNLDLDLKQFYKDLKNEIILVDVFKRFRGLRPMSDSLYEYLIIAIVLQNATVKRSVNMLQALFENYGALLEFDNQRLWCFWESSALAKANEQDLRNLKVGYRAKSLIKVSIPFARPCLSHPLRKESKEERSNFLNSSSFSEKEIDEFVLREKNQEEQEKILLSLYGIGPASTGYIMFDVFHHWDYLKHISPWEQKIYTKIFFNKNYEKNLVPVDKMLKYFNRWGKWKNLAIHYLWEDIWWKRRNEHIPWLERLIRL